MQEWTSGNNVAGCKQLEIKCVCANKDFLDGVACCLEDACDQAGKDAAVQFAQQICSTAGVDVPDKVVCKKTSTTSGSGNGTATVGTQTGTATDGATSETESPDAASGLDAFGGALSAMLAALLAL